MSFSLKLGKRIKNEIKLKIENDQQTEEENEDNNSILMLCDGGNEQMRSVLISHGFCVTTSYHGLIHSSSCLLFFTSLFNFSFFTSFLFFIFSYY